MQPAERVDAGGYGAAFAETLMDPARPVPPAVSGPRGKGAEKRYAVYRNNVTVSLIGALGATFPAVKRITGEDFFRALARAHIRSQPPTSPLLFQYGHGFADFIAAYEHAAEVPWLADLARIERAWLDAYHAADHAPLSAEALAAVAPEALGEIMLATHPATRIIRSPWPAASIFAAYRDGGDEGEIGASDPEDVLITRPDIDVFVRILPPGAAVFFGALIGGATLGDAAQAAFDDTPDFDLSANLAGLIETGAFTAIRGPGHDA